MLVPSDDNLIGQYYLLTSQGPVYAVRVLVYDRGGGLKGEVFKPCGWALRQLLNGAVRFKASKTSKTLARTLIY